MVVGAVLLFCGASIWFVSHRRASTIDTPAGLLARLPAKDAVILSIDFAALRRAGFMELLARSKTPEEPEYQQFVAKTEFDYKQDLDVALASFSPAGKYFLLRGRFNWGSLNSYAKAQSGGSCYNTLCEMPGSVPERKISFFPLRPQIMALAVTTTPDAAIGMEERSANPRQVDPPADPVWISFPGSVLQQADSLPTGTKMFAETVARAENVILSIGPQGKDFQATLAAHCKTKHDAAQVQTELERATQMLVSLLKRENTKPNPRDLSGTLTSGTFSHNDVLVSGHWPIAHELVESMLTGETH